jgi:hypothetical protein
MTILRLFLRCRLLQLLNSRLWYPVFQEGLAKASQLHSRMLLACLDDDGENHAPLANGRNGTRAVSCAAVAFNSETGKLPVHSTVEVDVQR